MDKLRIDPRDPLPIYAQVERGIKLAVATGELRVGERLPTVRQLAVDLKVNANTVARVYAELESQGVLETKRGVGTFIRSQAPPAKAMPRAERNQLLRTLAERFLKEATAHGFTARELAQQIERLSPRI
ncbi:MAG: GntR family transcriptional regulator [Pirellulales bacterium]